MSWEPIESAPTTIKWIVGVNAEGDSQTIKKQEEMWVNLEGVTFKPKYWDYLPKYYEDKAASCHYCPVPATTTIYGADQYGTEIGLVKCCTECAKTNEF